MKRVHLALIVSLIIGIFILIGSIIISRSIVQSKEEQSKYQMISHGDELCILDTVTGDYYCKYDDSNAGPTDWTKVENPFANEGSNSK